MLIYGLGNLPYPKSRHSVGQLIVDGLAAKFGAKLQYEPKIQSFHGEVTGLEMPGSPNNQRLKLSLAKSKHYMNISGPSVKQAYDQKLHNPQTFRPPNRRLVIIHDSIHQSPFKISPRFGGSANGHNGVRSVIAALGTTDFYRMRIGIGSPTQSRGILEQYVLDKLPPDELEYWSPGGEGIERVWESIVRMIEDEIEVGREERQPDRTKGLYLSTGKTQKHQRQRQHMQDGSKQQGQRPRTSSSEGTHQLPTETSEPMRSLPTEDPPLNRPSYNEARESHKLQNRAKATEEVNAISPADNERR